jgi:hypothetical protein
MKAPGGEHDDGHYCGECADCVDDYRYRDVGDAMNALPEWETPLHGIRANDTDIARLRESHAELLAAAKELAAAFAGARPDIAHLLGPAEIAAYDRTRTAIAKAEAYETARQERIGAAIAGAEAHAP